MSDQKKLEEYSVKFRSALMALKKLKEEVKILKEGHTEPIAIIGMSMRLPGNSSDAESYWNLLKTGKDAIGQVPEGRWNHEQLYNPEKGERGKINTQQAGFVENIELFDNHYFGLSPQEALYMDPQHRFLLETSYEALHNAGQNLQELKGSNTAVFVGFSDGSGYATRHMFTGNPADIDTYSLTGYMITGGAGRISYLLGLQGENVALNTGCSASLTALHLACQSLRTQQSDMALAAGVSLMCSPEIFVSLAAINGLSPDGRCKTFDASADGYGRGEGAGVLVLKRLSDALKDGDNILALIRGTASNQDGASNGFTAPSGKAQEKVILKALKNAGLTPADVDYVEAHGTGTPLGDPIEIEALHNTYGQYRSKENPLYVGSVKSNIGHLEGAAGIAGVMKVILSMQQKQIPQSLHFTRPNPHIIWDQVNVKVPICLQEWEKPGDKRRAGVSAFGVSGTNVHVILEEAPEALAFLAEKAICTKDFYFIPFTARSTAALKAYAQKLATYIAAPEQEGLLADVGANASLNATHYQCRKVVIGRTSEELQLALSSFAASAEESVDTEAFDANTAFVFPGQGSQWIGMGQELYASEPAFRQTIDSCEQAFSKYVAWSLTEELQKEGSNNRFAELDIIQPTLFAIEVALAKLWQSWGIAPQAVVGHSMGEVAAAYVADALDLQDAAAVICLRSLLMKEVSGKGGMLLVEMDVEQALSAIQDKEGRVAVAVSNSQHSTVLSGDAEAILQLKEDFDKKEIFCRLIKVDVASHSPHMNSVRVKLVQALQHIRPQPTTASFYSTVHKRIMKGEELTATYWGENLRHAVCFTQTTQQMLQDGLSVFLEMSPHPVLSMPLEQTIQFSGTEAYVLPSLARNEPEVKTFMAQWVKVWELGYPINWRLLYPELKRKLVLPAYVWQKKRFWLTNSPAYPTASATNTTATAALSLVAEERQAWPLSSFEETKQNLKPYLQNTIATITGYVAADVAENKRFSSLGLDSMMAMRIRNKLVKELTVDFSVKTFWKLASVGALAHYLAEVMHARQVSIEGAAAHQEWIITPVSRPEAKYRLFCFHDAGGNPNLYKDWSQKIDASIEVNLVQLPGRGTRLDEKPFTSIDSLLQELVPVINKYADKPFFFFGHSMGGIVLFELTQALRRKGLPLPQRLFISAAPNFKTLGEREAEYQLSDAALMGRFPGISCDLYEDKEFHKSLMQALRADLELLHHHTYRQNRPLEIPITAIAALEDSRVAASGLFAWKDETSSTFEIITRPGGHRYLDHDQTFLISLIEENAKAIPVIRPTITHEYRKQAAGR